jgi:alpha-D-ribose 1-methylphosphonate 5-triphosphate synthase subunit PhnG
MRNIDHADHQGTADAALQTEPEGSQNDRQIIKPLKDVMEHRDVERSKIMQQADEGDDEEKQDDSQIDI